MAAHAHATRHHSHFSVSYVVDHFRSMIAIHHQRRELNRMDDHMLDDLGISRRDAQAEAARPAWDVPHFWMS